MNTQFGWIMIRASSDLRESSLIAFDSRTWRRISTPVLIDACAYSTNQCLIFPITKISSPTPKAPLPVGSLQTNIEHTYSMKVDLQCAQPYSPNHKHYNNYIPQKCPLPSPSHPLHISLSPTHTHTTSNTNTPYTIYMCSQQQCRGPTQSQRHTPLKSAFTNLHCKAYTIQHD